MVVSAGCIFGWLDGPELGGRMTVVLLELRLIGVVTWVLDSARGVGSQTDGGSAGVVTFFADMVSAG